MECKMKVKGQAYRTNADVDGVNSQEVVTEIDEFLSLRDL